MLVFNEGLPRSGKSYDAVKAHLLVALKSGRKVYARINGLSHEKIADYLGLEIDMLREILILVSTAEVLTLFVAHRDMESDDREWRIADKLKNALFIIDECHEFYVASRESINPAVEQFFALCGQNGMDGLLMSQWYRRLHSSVRARIERKNVFQKLTAVGMTGKYNVTRFHTLSPDRFEKIGTETFTYDPKIFPLYKGYADGADNTAVYKAGGKTVWHKIGFYALFVVPLVVIAAFVFLHFFGPHSGLAKVAKPSRGPAFATGAPTLSAPSIVSSSIGRISHHGKMSDEQAYIFDLCQKARPRLAGLVTAPGMKPEGVIEWGGEQGAPLDRLTLSQVRDLGVVVQVHEYGIKLLAGKDSLIVTAWPLDTPSAPPGSTSDSPVAPSAPHMRPAGDPPAGAVADATDAGPPALRAGVGPQDYVPPGYGPTNNTYLPGGGG